MARLGYKLHSCRVERHEIALARPAMPPECSIDPWVRHGRAEQLNAPARNFSAYVAPRQRRRRFVRGSTALVFVHLSKCGGTTMKKALALVSKENGLDPPYTLYRRTWPQFLRACASESRDCDRDVYVGTNSFGACDFVRREQCYYVTVLREPVSRLLSSYQYFCQRGAENKKGWQKGWKRCEWSLLDWARLQPSIATVELSTSQAPTLLAAPARQTRDCPLLSDSPASERTASAAKSHFEAAMRNVLHGPIFAIALETLSEGFAQLAYMLDLKISSFPSLRENAASSSSLPRGTHPTEELVDDEKLSQLRNIIRYDLALYAAVRAHNHSATFGIFT